MFQPLQHFAAAFMLISLDAASAMLILQRFSLLLMILPALPAILRYAAMLPLQMLPMPCRAVATPYAAGVAAMRYDCCFRCRLRAMLIRALPCMRGA